MKNIYIFREVRKVVDGKYFHQYHYEFTSNDHVTDKFSHYLVENNDYHNPKFPKNKQFWIDVADHARELFGNQSDGYELIPIALSDMTNQKLVLKIDQVLEAAE